MQWSRRELSFLLPALAAAQNTADTKPLDSGAYPFDSLPARKSGAGTARQFFKGLTHSGYLIDLHESELPAGEAPHAAHHHVHEELVLVVEGQLDATVGGRTTRLGPGSAVYFASNQEHGFRNAGNTTARYFVLALGGDQV